MENKRRNGRDEGGGGGGGGVGKSGSELRKKR